MQITKTITASMKKAAKKPTAGQKQMSKVKSATKETIGEIARILTAHETPSVMLTDHNVFVRSAYDRDNVQVDQVFLDSGVVTIKAEGQNKLNSGHYYLEDIIGVLIGLEKAIAERP